MNDNISRIIDECKHSIENVSDLKTIADIRVKFLGKSGKITELLKGMKDLSAEEKPKFGKVINEAKEAVAALIAEKEETLKNAVKNIKLKSEYVDITMPGKKVEKGALNPLTNIRNEIIDAFMGLGFTISEGPEIETDYYSFQALNIPKDHPARDMQDTFYISDNVVLRPHTSPAQVRTMEIQKPPIKILSPGRVYRADDDATHSPMFSQIEGLVVDKNVTLCDLKGMLDEFAKKIFTSETKTRFRPSYFPFTEPSVEVDVSCMMCHGKGCRLCKGTGWIEILGSGMVNRNVLLNCGIDPDVYTGFAFGMGIERIAMIKYGIPQMKILFENDMRFLKEFE